MKFRSKFERKVYDISIKGRVKGAKYESIRLPFRVLRHYNPDWVFPNGVVVEIKGRFTATDRAKHLAVKQAHPAVDIRFVFQYDNTLNKKSTTRYSDWCEKHGFLYAFKSVPKDWTTGPKRKVVVNDKI